LPCRRLPIKVGNLLTDDLLKLYLNSERLQQIRDVDESDEKCSSCFYEKSCGGGLKCLSYAAFGDYAKKDPHCWL